jgi:asparagine synthase (glutamine-hydrolysing)
LKYLIKKIAKKVLGYQNSALSKLSQEDQSLITNIREKKLTYLSSEKLVCIVDTCREIENQNLSGIMVEAGCALGGSSILISKIKDEARPLFVYDVFGMIPPPTSEDGEDVRERYKTINQGKSKGLKGDAYYGYEKDLFNKVLENLHQSGVNVEQDRVHLIKGLLQDTMTIDRPVAFAHIDVDWYEPVKICLERIIPRLVVGGSVILDDYHDWSGCKKATDEFFKEKSLQFVMDDSAGSMKVTRIKE